MLEISEIVFYLMTLNMPKKKAPAVKLQHICNARLTILCALFVFNMSKSKSNSLEFKLNDKRPIDKSLYE